MGRFKNAAPWGLAAVFVLLLGVLPAGAQPTVDSLSEQGWVETQAGVWQRINDEGRLETQAMGSEGIAYGLDLLRTQLTTLTASYLDNPTKEAYQALEDHTRFIEAVEEGSRIASRRAAPAKACDYDLEVGTDAGPFSPPHCGGGSSAYSNYTVTGAGCDDACHIYAYTYWSHTCGSQTLTGSLSCSDFGTSVSCSLWDHAPYGANDSITVSAYAYIYCPDQNNLFLSDYSTDTFTHPLCPQCG